MLLPMFGFFSVLVVFGGITSLAVLIDKYSAKRAPYPFAVFFAGLISWVFVLFMFGLGEILDKNGVKFPHLVGSIIFFGSPLVSLIGGALMGYHLGVNRRNKYAHLWE